MATILIIGSVWPEPESTAAGQRILQIIEQLKTQNHTTVFACAAVVSPFSFDLKSINVETVAIELNNCSFDKFVISLQPHITIFDRFMIEEQFGWRVHEHVPDCIRILDTEDLHFVRATRMLNLKKQNKTTAVDYLHSDIAKREIASIYRCDLSLIISDIEMQILTSIFKIDASILLYLPFLLNEINLCHFEQFPAFADRCHFITIGNFRHEPNWNSVLYLKDTIWPLIRRELPDTEMHIYGSYVTQKAMQLNNANDGFLVKGRADNVQNVVGNARILLAPIRFGAGIKGKLTDAMCCGTPSVTTTVGAESMSGQLDWSGIVANDPQDFANAAVTLYNNEIFWKTAQQNGIMIINERFNKSFFGKSFLDRIEKLQINIENHRVNNFIGQMLNTQILKSNKYMSKWIEEKNKKISI